LKIRLRLRRRAVTVVVARNETARDFVSLLPLTLTMRDLFGREKFARMPRTLSAGGKRTSTYAVGDVVYWSPGPDVAVYYRHDGKEIPHPGVIPIGKIDSGIDALDTPGSVRLTVERVLPTRTTKR
jgi:hypothetical protein